MVDRESDISMTSMDISSSAHILDDALSEEESDCATSKHLDEKKKNIMSAIAISASAFYENYLHKTPCYDRDYSGWAALMSIMNGNPTRCHQLFRMHNRVFFKLCALLVHDYGLKPARYVPAEEKLATFMMIVGPQEGRK